MPEKLYGLTEAQRDFLQDLLDESRARRKNTTNRFTPSEPPFSGSEAYIALTPAGGIPALITAGTGTGTGTGGAFDVVGSADCNIYKIFQYKDLGNIGDLKKTVYNLSESDIPGDIYITVIKDKSGKWLAQTGEASSTPTTPTNVVAIQCTSLTPNPASGCYPGILQSLQHSLPITFINGASIVFNPLNGGKPILNHRYGGIPAGFKVFASGVLVDVYQLVCTMPSTQSGAFYDG